MLIDMEKRVCLPSRIESLREVEKLVDEISAECNLSSELYGNVLIATLEAANNAILHGNKLDGKKEVEIVVSYDEDKLMFVVKDQGEGFDYSHVPDPTAPENIEKVNGRGVFLMEKLSDGLIFHDKGSKVELLFNI